MYPLVKEKQGLDPWLFVFKVDVDAFDLTCIVMKGEVGHEERMHKE